MVSKGVGYLLVCTFVFGKSLRLCRYYKRKGIEMQQKYHFDNTTLLPTLLLIDLRVYSTQK